MSRLFGTSAAAVLLALAQLQTTTAQSGYGGSSGKLPIVDLGYELQQASSYNSSGGFYNFSNIRYAAPPTGENRFTVPQPPKVNRTVVQPGTPNRICPQAQPAWEIIAAQFIPDFVAGQTVFNASSFQVPASTGQLPVQDPATTEDCLFLDVVVPQDIFNNKGKSKGAPVLVWIYGGGYTAGSKSGSGNPAGLLARSENNNGGGVIYVAMNYRLGAFGWLAGPTFQANGTANVGLYDQRFALEWVQANIAKFGGDPDRVTVFGESAGGGSIMHQITAYAGNKGSPPFQQAILQSPGFQPVVSNYQEEQIFSNYLALLNVSTLEEARQLPYSALQTANIIQVGLSPYGQFTYGPAVDGNFVPALPGELLLHHKFPTDLKIMVGHNADEGLLFTSPFIQNDTALAQQLALTLPTSVATPSIIEYITTVLYPPIFDGSQAMGYTSQVARAAALISELIFTCNTFYLDKAYGNNTYAYFFTVPPAIHGEDIAYTYYNGPSPSVISVPVAIALQEYITRFAETGQPNEAGVPFFNIYGANATVTNLNITGIREQMDPTANYRCNWWQKALYQ